MKRMSVWLKGLAVAIAVVAMVVGMTSLTSRVGAAEDINIKHPPPGGGCICPTNYDPVTCRDANGNSHTFSNACVAGCNGYTAAQCGRVIVVGE